MRLHTRRCARLGAVTGVHTGGQLLFVLPLANAIVRFVVAMGWVVPLPTLAAAGRMREANDGQRDAPCAGY